MRCGYNRHACLHKADVSWPHKGCPPFGLYETNFLWKMQYCRISWNMGHYLTQVSPAGMLENVSLNEEKTKCTKWQVVKYFSTFISLLICFKVSHYYSFVFTYLIHLRHIFRSYFSIFNKTIYALFWICAMLVSFSAYSDANESSPYVPVTMLLFVEI